MCCKICLYSGHYFCYPCVAVIDKFYRISVSLINMYMINYDSMINIENAVYEETKLK